MDPLSVALSTLVTGSKLSTGGAWPANADGRGEEIYQTLCERLAHHHHVDSLGALADPSLEDAAKELTLRNEFVDSNILDDPETVDLLSQLHALLLTLPQQTARDYAIDVGNIEAGRNILIEHVDSLRAHMLKAGDNLTLKNAGVMAAELAPNISLGRATARTIHIELHQHYTDAPAAFNDATSADHLGYSVRPDEQICPYRGLDTFRMEDAHLFAGRDDEVTELVTALDVHALVGVIAASGSGKSSLVYAGLLPALNDRDDDAFWDVFAFKPGREPLKSLSRTMARVLGPYGDLDEELEQINRRVRNVRSGDVTVRDLVAHVREQRLSEYGARTHRVLFFVDQWEELYTQLDDPRDRITLLRDLLDVADREEAQLLLTMRADFMGEMLSQDRAFFEKLEPGIQYLKPMSTENMREVIGLPAAQVGLQIPDGLASQMIDDTVDEPGYLPYLQFALKQLWQRRDKTTHSLTAAAYEELDGIKGAIGKHAQSVYRTKLTDAERALTQVVLPRLVHVSGFGSDVSIRQPLSGFSDAGQALLRKLSGKDSRLVVLHGDDKNNSDSVVVEVAHEAIIREWTDLKQWISTKETQYALRGKLDNDAARWVEQNKHNDYLIHRGKPLFDAQELLHVSGSDEISIELLLYVNSSIAAENKHENTQRLRTEKERNYEKSLRREAEARALLLRRVTFGAVTVAIGVFAFALVFKNERDKAVELQSIAETESAKARMAEYISTKNESAALIRIAQDNLDNSFPEKAAKLALAAWPSKLNDTRPAFKENWKLFRFLIPELLERIRLEEPEGALLGASYDNDRQRILTWSLQGSVSIWEATSGVRLSHFKHSDAGIYGAAMSHDSERVLTWSNEDLKIPVRVWSTTEDNQNITLDDFKGWVHEAFFVENPLRIITHSSPMVSSSRLSKAHIVASWNVQSGKLVVFFWLKQDGAILGARFSEDRNRVVTWNINNTLRVWDIHEGSLLASHENLTFDIKDVELSTDGSQLLIWGEETPYNIWDVESNSITEVSDLNLVPNTSGGWGRFSPSGSLIAVKLPDSSAGIWDVKLKSMVAKTDPMKYGIKDIVFSPDESRMVVMTNFSFGDDTAPVFFDIKNNQIKSNLQGHEGEISGASFSTNSQRILTWSSDGSGRVWSADGTLEHILKGHGGEISHAEISDDGSSVLTSSFDGSARVWDVKLIEPHVKIEGMRSNGTGVYISPDISKYVTLSKTGKAELWDTRHRVKLADLDLHGGKFLGVTFTDDSSKLISWSSNCEVLLWNAESGLPGLKYAGCSSSIEGAIVTTTASHVLAWTSDSTILVWDAKSRELLHRKKMSVAVSKIHLTKSDQTVLLELKDTTSALWHAADGRMISSTEYSDPGYAREPAQFTNDRLLEIVRQFDEGEKKWIWAVNLLSFETGQIVETLEGHKSHILGATFSPDGLRAISWSQDKTAKVWDANTGDEIFTLEGHKRTVHRAVFSPSGEYIITNSYDGSVRLWDAKTGEGIYTVPYNSGLGTDNIDLAISDRYIAFLADRGKIKLLYVEGGHEFATLYGEFATMHELEDKITQLRFSPNDDYLLAVTDAGVHHIWRMSDIATGGVFENICERLTDHKLRSLGKEFKLELADSVCVEPSEIPIINHTDLD